MLGEESYPKLSDVKDTIPTATQSLVVAKRCLLPMLPPGLPQQPPRPIYKRLDRPLSKSKRLIIIKVALQCIGPRTPAKMITWAMKATMTLRK